MVDILCAIAIVVLLTINAFRLSYTNYSLAASKALVASSRSNKLQSLNIALAIAILYFYPPEI